MAWHGESYAVVEDAVHVVDVSLLLVHLLSGEETGRRHLLRVAHTDECLAARYCSNSLARRHLRCLVEHHKVEFLALHVDVLRHADGAHQHHRTQFRQQSGYLVNYLAYACAASSVSDVALQYAHLRVCRCRNGLTRYAGGEAAVEFFLGEFLESVGLLAVFLYYLLEQQSVEHAQLLVLVNHLHGQTVQHSLAESERRIACRGAFLHDISRNAVQPLCVKCRRAVGVLAPVLQFVDVGKPSLRESWHRRETFLRAKPYRHQLLYLSHDVLQRSVTAREVIV